MCVIVFVCSILLCCSLRVSVCLTSLVFLDWHEVSGPSEHFVAMVYELPCSVIVVVNCLLHTADPVWFASERC